MNTKEIVNQVFDRLKSEGYYSELEPIELKKVFNRYLLSEYRKAVKQQSIDIEKEKGRSGKEPEMNIYEEAYAQVENHILYISEALAATTKKDINDLKYLV